MAHLMLNSKCGSELIFTDLILPADTILLLVNLVLHSGRHCSFRNIVIVPVPEAENSDPGFYNRLVKKQADGFCSKDIPRSLWTARSEHIACNSTTIKPNMGRLSSATCLSFESSLIPCATLYCACAVIRRELMRVIPFASGERTEKEA